MPKRRRANTKTIEQPPCSHRRIYFDVSPDAAFVGFQRLSENRRRAAAAASGRIARSSEPIHDEHSDSLMFPGPLVLEDDDLFADPRQPPQTLRSWMTLKERNPVTDDRRTLYVVSPPEVTAEVNAMTSWTRPRAAVRDEASRARPPTAEGIRDYLEAFYHGMEVKVFSGQFKWVPWRGTKVSMPDSEPKFVGLACPNDAVVRIRCRSPLDEVPRRQINLDDVLDGLLENVPDDAYAIVMLVHHDIYEDKDDVFCGGRAYGGSRIAVMSSFRYGPMVDAITGPPVPHHHGWPASHCSEYVEGGVRGKHHENTAGIGAEGALTEAVKASAGILPRLAPDLSALWAAKVSKGVSHELGHCFGIGHCVFYACVMQGSSGMSEDDRQPPYLCPVCLAKVTCGILRIKPGQDEVAEREYVLARDKALVAYCSKFPNVMMLVGLEQWLQVRMRQLY